MSANPGREISPGFCHIRRHSNRSAQKQIICPIYRGNLSLIGYIRGAGTRKFVLHSAELTLEAMKTNSSLENERNEPIMGGLPQDPAPLTAGSIRRLFPFGFTCDRCSGRSVRCLRWLSGVRLHEVIDARDDLRSEPRPVKHPVVTNILLHVMGSPVVWDRCA